MDAPHVQKPSEVTNERGFFDRFAERASQFVSRAPFFAFCLLLVVAWLIEGAVKVASGGNFLDGTYQLQINTTTTIITFLMVAILQNSQSRFEAATSKKLNALADSFADFMEYVAADDDSDKCARLMENAKELRAAVGLEQREST